MKTELLAPAGNMECLKTALYFGADAVYAAGKQFGLRAFADNFTLEELAEAAGIVHGQGKRIYLTINALMKNEELPALEQYCKDVQAAGVDAVIVSDPAALVLARAAGLEVHLSTQASTINSLSARFWHSQGVKRVVLAREATLEDIRQIRADIPDELELEAFIHGAMCIAYSGRCLLSSVFTGRSGNRGECAQPCRWQYEITEKGYPDMHFPIEEDSRGTYLLNSKDLMMLEHIPELMESGINSFKIEGRMKSAYYVACVVNAYRRAIDGYLRQGAAYALDSRLLADVKASATRRFTTGFYFGNPGSEGQDVEKLLSQERSMVFCAKVLAPRDERGLVLVEQRNRFFTGETLSLLSPHYEFETFSTDIILAEDGTEQDSAPHPQQRVYIRSPYDLQPGDMLRRAR